MKTQYEESIDYLTGAIDPRETYHCAYVDCDGLLQYTNDEAPEDAIVVARYVWRKGSTPESAAIHLLTLLRGDLARRVDAQRDEIEAIERELVTTKAALRGLGG